MFIGSGILTLWLSLRIIPMMISGFIGQKSAFKSVMIADQESI